MKIDRSIFLVLTGTLAAVACSSKPASSPAAYTSPDADPAFPSMKKTVAAAPTTATATPTPPPTADTPRPAPPPSPPKRDSKTIANNTEEDTACGHTNKRFNASKAGCNDAVGAPLNCKALGVGFPAKEGCQRGDDLVGLCDGYKRAFKPRIAAQAFGCIARVPAAQKCDSCNTQACGYDALMDACPDPTADADCEEIGKRCEALDTGRCRAFLSGMSVQGRLAMKTCMMSDCHTGLFDCARTVGGAD